MGYTTSNGIYVDTIDLNLDPLEGSLTQDGYSAEIELGDNRALTLYLDVTAVSTSDTLDCTLQGSDDGGTTWRTIHAFTQNTGVSAEYFTGVGARKIRAFFDVTGSSITIVCTLRGEAV